MSTLAEIEAAVKSLPRPEQEVLLGFLTDRLRGTISKNGAQGNRVQLPLVHSGQPGSMSVTNAQIEEFLSE